MGLKKTATSGLLWTFLDTAIVRGIGVFAAILLARLLSPVEFGLMGMIYVFTSIAATLVDSGLTSSLIRSKEANASDYTTVFYTNIVFSFFLYFVLFAAAPVIADFYDQNVLTDIIRIYGLLFVITSFSAVQQTILIKKMEFKRLMLLNIPGIIIGACTGIFMAYADYGVWSIIIMHLITQTIFALILWAFSSWKPNMHFSILKLKKHFNFGYKITLISFLNSIVENIYYVIFGKFFAVSTLGEFERAKTLTNYPVRILTSTISKVTYPLLSSIQENNEKLKEGYKKIMILTFFVSLPLMLILSAVSDELIIIFLGDKWIDMSFFFKILCFASTLYPIHAFNMNLLKVYGKTNLLLKLEFIKKIINICLVFIALPFGIVFIAWSIVVYSVISLFINTYYTDKLIEYSLFQQFKDNSLTIIISFLIYWLIRLFLYNNTDTNYIQLLIISVLGGGFLYLLLNFIFNNYAIILIKEIIKLKKT